METSPSELLAQAVTYKEKGNAFFKEGNHNKALFHYHQALSFTKQITLPGEQNVATSQAQMMGRNHQSEIPAEEKDALQRLKASTNLNMAMCYTKKEVPYFT